MKTSFVEITEFISCGQDPKANRFRYIEQLLKLTQFLLISCYIVKCYQVIAITVFRNIMPAIISNNTPKSETLRKMHLIPYSF